MDGVHQTAKKDEKAEGRGFLARMTRRAFIGTSLFAGGYTLGKGCAAAHDHFYGLSYEIDKITDHIERRLKSVPEDEILFVPMGEYHGQPAHKIVTQGVIAALKQRGVGTAIGMEYPYDRVPANIAQNYERPYMEDWEREYLPTPKNVDAAAETQNYLNARQAVRQFLKFLYAESIPFDFNDLGTVWRDDKEYLDVENIRLSKGAAVRTKTQALLRPDLTAGEPLGMYLRNDEMKSNAYSSAYGFNRDVQPVRVYIQHCGAGHLIGSNEYPFEQSLCHLMQKSSIPVLGIDLTDDMASVSPEARAFVEGGGLLSIANVNKRSFDYTGLDEVATRKLEIIETAYLADLCSEARVKCYMQPPEMGPLAIPKLGL